METSRRRREISNQRSWRQWLGVKVYQVTLLSEQIDIMQLNRDEAGVVSEYSCGVTTKYLVIPHQDSF